VTLTWDASYAVARELRRLHPAEDLATVSLGQIQAWTIALPDFEDDPALANDEVLYAIYQDWFEEQLDDNRIA